MTIASILAPVDITAAMLVSSTVAETVALWNSATTYGVGDRVRHATTNRVYENQLASNLNKDPSDINNRAGAVIWWVDIDATNRWKVFDNSVSSQTSFTTSATYVITPGIFNTIYLAGLDATGLSISIKDAPGGTVIFTETSNLEGSMPGDYYEYFYDRFKPRKDYIISGLTPYTTAEVTITLTASTGLCGLISFGDLRPLGDTLRGAKAKPKTSSYIKINDYLQAEIVKRKKAKDLSFTTFLDHEETDSVLDTLTDYLDVPCLVIASEAASYQSLRAYGLVSGEASFENPKVDLLTINVNGLI